MSQMDRKVKKKKEREREVHKKVLRRRKALRAEAKKTRDQQQAERDAIRQVNKHVTTIRHGERRMTDEEIRKKLEENMKLLEGLEQEYAGTMKSREQFLRELEARQANEPQGNWGGSADVSVLTFETKEERLAYEKEQAEKNKHHTGPEAPTEPEPAAAESTVEVGTVA